MARKRRKVAKDKKTKIPKKYLEGLKGSKRSARASLLKTMSSLYKSGARIPRSMFRARVK
jgi:DNA polymerase III delta prime subunit